MIIVEFRDKEKVKNSNCFLTEIEIKSVSTWIRKSEDIKMISAPYDWNFNESTLMKWCSTVDTKDTNSKHTKKVFAVALLKDTTPDKKSKKDEIIGFCTLTNTESNFFNNKEVEVCHLIVKPEYRKKYNGTNMVSILVEEAFRLNFEKVYGRVYKGNQVGRAFMTYLNWNEVENNDPDCNWFVIKNDTDRFSNILLERMSALDNMSITDLASLLGMSKQYINSLKNPLVGHPTKLPSPQLLHMLCLILGQKKATLFNSFFIDKKTKGETWKDFKQYLFNKQKDKNYSILYENLDYKVVNKILLSYSQLQKLETGFIYVDNGFTFNETQIIENVFGGKDKKEIRKDYEIWTLSNILGEQLSVENAKETVENIYKYKIKYRFFMPIQDQDSWRLAWKNIILASNKLRDEEVAYSEYWSKIEETSQNKNTLLDYISFYGVPENMLFFKLRIYDALNNTSSGTLNLGGSTQDDFKFIALPDEIREKVITIIQKILISEQIEINSLDNTIEVREYNLKIKRNYPIIKK